MAEVVPLNYYAVGWAVNTINKFLLPKQIYVTVTCNKKGYIKDADIECITDGKQLKEFVTVL